MIKPWPTVITKDDISLQGGREVSDFIDFLKKNASNQPVVVAGGEEEEVKEKKKKKKKAKKEEL